MSFQLRSVVVVVSIDRSSFPLQVSPGWNILEEALNWYVSLFFIVASACAVVRHFVHIKPKAAERQFIVEGIKLVMPPLSCVWIQPVNEGYVSWPNSTCENSSLRMLNKYVLEYSISIGRVVLIRCSFGNSSVCDGKVLHILSFETRDELRKILEVDLVVREISVSVKVVNITE